MAFIRGMLSNLRYRRLRKDLTRLGVGDFVVKHAGNTREARTLLTVNLIGILGDSATAAEQVAIKKALAAIIYVEQGDGWASTLKLSRRIPSLSSVSMRGVGAPRRTPPPYTPSSPHPKLSINTRTMFGLAVCAFDVLTPNTRTNIVSNKVARSFIVFLSSLKFR